jgi:hypothetical protein
MRRLGSAEGGSAADRELARRRARRPATAASTPRDRHVSLPDSRRTTRRRGGAANRRADAWALPRARRRRRRRTSAFAPRAPPRRRAQRRRSNRLIAPDPRYGGRAIGFAQWRARGRAVRARPPERSAHVPRFPSRPYIEHWLGPLAGFAPPAHVQRSVPRVAGRYRAETVPARSPSARGARPPGRAPPAPSSSPARSAPCAGADRRPGAGPARRAPGAARRRTGAKRVAPASTRTRPAPLPRREPPR